MQEGAVFLHPPQTGSAVLKAVSVPFIFPFKGELMRKIVLSVIMDIICVLLPLPVIWKIQVTWRKLVALVFVLALGLL